MLPANKHSSVISFPFAPDQNLLPLMSKLTQTDKSFPVANVASHNSVSEVPLPSINNVPASALMCDPCKRSGKSNHHYSRPRVSVLVHNTHMKCEMVRSNRGLFVKS